jgi:hypothetical protein
MPAARHTFFSVVTPTPSATAAAWMGTSKWPPASREATDTPTPRPGWGGGRGGRGWAGDAAAAALLR